jgi:Na+-transporting NADH:ubiquinone oxidoreductase subunit NqrB
MMVLSSIAVVPDIIWMAKASKQQQYFFFKSPISLSH